MNSSNLVDIDNYYLQNIFDHDEWDINNYLDDIFDDILYKGIEWLYDYENNEYDIYDEINKGFIRDSISPEYVHIK